MPAKLRWCKTPSLGILIKAHTLGLPDMVVGTALGKKRVSETRGLEPELRISEYKTKSPCYSDF